MLVYHSFNHARSTKSVNEPTHFALEVLLTIAASISCHHFQGKMCGRCGRLGSVQRHLTSIMCEGSQPPKALKPAWERGYLHSCFFYQVCLSYNHTTSYNSKHLSFRIPKHLQVLAFHTSSIAVLMLILSNQYFCGAVSFCVLCNLRLFCELIL